MLTRAPLLLTGYWPDPEETEAVLRGGWLHTGDLVEYTPHGDIRLIGRKKDVIVTRGGKTISPHETRLKESPLINEAIVVGEARKYLTVLPEPSTTADALSAEASTERLRTGVDRVDADLARAEQLKDFRVLRNAVVRSFATPIDEMYDANDDVATADHVRSRSD
ncbi:hypothetical protein [Kitasatospora sp. NPDC087271]|uniref:hypothetical protein n=1 Tax=Kitasatospora sp. NPDC087271 TaxID=3364067 RepID=UPI0037F5EEAA